MSIGTAFHPRTAPLNRKMQWREWSGYFASSAYADFHDIEYNAIREAAALIDVSPLFKYRVSGPDAQRLVDRVITRDATKLKVGQVFYTPWCDEHGKVVDDGTIHRLDERRFRWTAADPSCAGSARTRAASTSRSTRPPKPSPRSPSRARSRATSWRPRPASRSPTCATSAAARRGSAEGRDRRVADRLHRRPRLRAVDPVRSRRGGVGPLMEAGQAVRHPAGRDARARRRPARGRADPARGRLHVGPPRAEPRAELLALRDRPRAPGRASTRPTSSGRLALEREARRAARRDGWSAWSSTGTTSSGLYAAQGLPPAIPRTRDRSPVPVFAERGGQIGRATSRGWSPILKKAIALASVPPSHEAAGLGSRLSVEWTVEGRRGRVGATVVSLPFLDLPRKRSRVGCFWLWRSSSPGSAPPSAGCWPVPLISWSARRVGFHPAQRLGQVRPAEAQPEVVAWMAELRRRQAGPLPPPRAARPNRRCACRVRSGAGSRSNPPSGGPS